MHAVESTTGLGWERRTPIRLRVMDAIKFTTGSGWERRTPIRPCAMHAIESTAGSNWERRTPIRLRAMHAIPQEVAAQLPKTGRARIIVPAGEGTGGAGWRLGACRQFLRDDSPEDAICDSRR